MSMEASKQLKSTPAISLSTPEPPPPPNQNVKLIDSVEAWDQWVPWFLEGDLSVVGLDTETMGVNWLRIKREIYKERDSAKIKELEKSLKQYAREALKPTTCHLATLQLASSDERCLVILLNPELHLYQRAKELLENIGSRIGVTWVIHNAKFDLKQLHAHFKIQMQDWNVFDTMLAESLRLGDSSNLSTSLAKVSERYPHPGGLRKGDSESTVSDWWTFPLTQKQIDYAAFDALLMPHLYRTLRSLIKQKGLDRVADLESKVILPLIKMEEIGFRFAKDKLWTFMQKAGDVVKDQEEIFREHFGSINPSSPQQVLKKVEELYGVTPTISKWDTDLRCFTKKPSTDKKALLQAGIRHEVGVDALITIKELKRQIKLASDWFNNPSNEFLTEFIQLKKFDSDEGKGGGTRTGRMSSTPNIQNIDGFMKQFLEASPGWTLWSCDYSAIEFRLCASYAGEKVLHELFAAGRDPHTEMAQWAFKMENVGKKSTERRIAKEVNFGFIFGMSGRAFCTRVLNATDGEIRLSVDEGNDFRNKFFERYPAIRRWHEAQFANACLHGYVTTRSGRRREYNPSYRPTDIPTHGRIYHPVYATWFTSAMAPDWKWRNVSFNTPIQGTAGDGLKESIVLLHKDTPDFCRPAVTVHDSIDGWCREDKVIETYQFVTDRMKQGMAKYMPDVPVEVEFTAGFSWAPKPDKERDPRHGLWMQDKFQEEIIV